ncbi:MAG: GTPase HflX [Stomatobaculum sp.]|nr:GTPase HflX [Stomatobaculum sp.]
MAAFFGADEIWSRHDDDTKEPVVLAGVRETSGADAGLSEEDFQHSLDELAELAKACMMDPRAVVAQQMPKVSAGLYVGTGKAEEIRIAAANVGASRVIFNDTLSPSQIRNLQKALELPVMDRTALILEIFERRARSREARLQVELAKLNYLKPRLIGMWETQNRQGGASGSMSAKGEGETQLEIDRRTIDHRLAELRREIKSVAKERELRRKKRRESGLPLVSLVGYTNAGKSTMMNALLEYCEGNADETVQKPLPDPVYGTAETPSSNQSPADKKKVFEADMLFATLDTTVRKITVNRGREFLLSDTVGFIHRLPTALVEAFHSTLEEITQADLLLQIVDGSDPHCQEHIEVTKKTVEELGAGHIPMVTVYNKADLAEPPVRYPRRGIKDQDAGGVRNEAVWLSAKDPASIEFLIGMIFEKLDAGMTEHEFLVPYHKGQVVSFLMENAMILKTEYTDAGTALTVRCDRVTADRVMKMLA